MQQTTGNERTEIDAAMRRRDESLGKLVRAQNAEANDVRLARVEQVRQNEIARAQREGRAPDTARADSLKARIQQAESDRLAAQRNHAFDYQRNERELQRRIGECPDASLRAEMAAKERDRKVDVHLEARGIRGELPAEHRNRTTQVDDRGVRLTEQQRSSMRNIMDYCDRHGENGPPTHNAEADRQLKVRQIAGGFDFAGPVKVDGVDAGRDLRTRSLNGSPGAWYTDPGVDADRTGVANVNRTPEAYRTRERVEVLSGTACATRDSWTEQGKQNHEVRGGGQQYYVSRDQKPNLERVNAASNRHGQPGPAAGERRIDPQAAEHKQRVAEAKRSAEAKQAARSSAEATESPKRAEAADGRRQKAPARGAR